MIVIRRVNDLIVLAEKISLIVELMLGLRNKFKVKDFYFHR